MTPLLRVTSTLRVFPSIFQQVTGSDPTGGSCSPAIIGRGYTVQTRPLSTKSTLLTGGYPMMAQAVGKELRNEPSHGVGRHFLAREAGECSKTF